MSTKATAQPEATDVVVAPGGAGGSGKGHGPTDPRNDPAEPGKGAARRRSRREQILTILPFIMALAGAIVLGYPVVATLHNNTEQQRIADQYQAKQDAAGPDALAAELAGAEKYNSTLESMPILDPWIETERPDSPAYKAYLAELDLDEVMSQIVIPKIHTDLPIYHGTTPDILQKGVGHLFGTSLPVGGAGTHAVLTGHTGLGSATLFDHLTELEKGDVFYVNTAGRSMKYKVTDIRVVLPEETDSLRKVPGEDLVTLITCTPYGINTHRLLVTGTRVPLDPVEAEKEQADATPAPMQTWMIWLIGAVVLILVVLAVILLRMLWRRIKRKREEERAAGATAAGSAADDPHAAEADPPAAEPDAPDAPAGEERPTDSSDSSQEPPRTIPE